MELFLTDISGANMTHVAYFKFQQKNTGHVLQMENLPRFGNNRIRNYFSITKKCTPLKIEKMFQTEFKSEGDSTELLDQLKPNSIDPDVDQGFIKDKVQKLAKTA